MQEESSAKLQQLGLSPAEADIYLALVQHGPRAAAAVATAAGLARTSVYPALGSLADKGLIEGGTGHGSKFAAIAPHEALRALIKREKEMLSERERVAIELGETLGAVAADAESAMDDTVQVVRTPQVISERFTRLQLEARRHIEVFIKTPILIPQRRNPAQKKAGKRGVHYKGLYERAVLQDPKVQPYLEQWAAEGEESRVYDGELPYKLVIFDSEVVLSTLVRRSGQPAALLIRHAPFARSMSILFNHFWEQAKPLAPNSAKGLNKTNNNARSRG